MTESGLWNPYSGTSALVLAVILFVITGILAYIGTRLRRSVAVTRPGRMVSFFLCLIFLVSMAAATVAIVTYDKAWAQVYNAAQMPKNPITPITDLCILATFLIIFFLNRRQGSWLAVGGAIVGTMAGPIIFEFPFDLIVMTRIYPPSPAVQYTLLYFLPLFVVEITIFALLTLSPLMKLSKYTLFSLSAMFFIFAVWALFGFSYPSNPLSIAFNGLSKIVSFVTAVTLFLPNK
jgi:hypothetical protein